MNILFRILWLCDSCFDLRKDIIKCIIESRDIYCSLLTNNNNSSVALIRKRTIPTTRPTLVGEVTANVVSAAEPYGRNL
jgi:hypothetical protein